MGIDSHSTRDFMAPYQFFFLFVGLLFIGISAVAFNQAAIASEPSPAHRVVEQLPDAPGLSATPDVVRL